MDFKARLQLGFCVYTYHCCTYRLKLDSWYIHRRENLWQSIDIMYIWKFELRLCGNNLGHLAIHNTTNPSVILLSPIFIQPSISHSIVDISLPSTHYIYIIEGRGPRLSQPCKVLYELPFQNYYKKLNPLWDLLDNPLPTERFEQYAKKVCLYRVVVLTM